MSASLHRPLALRGLYVILDPAVLAPRDPAEVAKEAAAAGARLFQYRDKTASMSAGYRCAVRLRDATAQAGALLIVNDRCDLALAVEADGVHLGQEDLPYAEARRLMGSALIGLSTHRLDQLEAAVRAGPDYVAYGPIFATATKPGHAPVVGLEGLAAARARTRLPLFAIGGITMETAEAVKRAGADGAAVISALAAARDIAETVRIFIERLT